MTKSRVDTFPKKMRLFLHWVPALLTVSLLCQGPPQAQPTSEKLKAIELRINEIREKMATLNQEKNSLLNDIEKIELQIETAKIERDRLDLMQTDLKWQVDKNNREKNRLEKKIERGRENLQRLLRILYKLGEAGALKIFLSIERFEQLFRNFHLIDLLLNAKMEQIATIRHDQQQLARIERKLQTQLQNLAALRREKSIALERLSGWKQEKISFISRINREKESQTQLLEELQQEAEDLNRLMDQKRLPATAVLVAPSLYKGKLLWPIAGEVIALYGKQKSARFNTYTFNNGIEIKPGQEEEIRAVLPGEVIFADYFRGYGNLLIIQHTRNFHTLYGHCDTFDSFTKKKGDFVQQNEIIARVGSSGSTTEKSLYFEIRENLKPADPLKWLRKR